MRFSGKVATRADLIALLKVADKSFEFDLLIPAAARLFRVVTRVNVNWIGDQ